MERKLITVFIYHCHDHLFLIHTAYYKSRLQRGHSVDYNYKLAIQSYNGLSTTFNQNALHLMECHALE